MTNPLVESCASELRNLEKSCAWVYQVLNTLANKELAPIAVFLKGGIGRIRTGPLTLLHEHHHMITEGFVISFKEG